MKTILATAALSAAMLSTAWAVDVEGTVKEINLTDRTITLENGGAPLQVKDDVELEYPTVGEYVLLITDEANVVTDLIVVTK